MENLRKNGITSHEKYVAGEITAAQIVENFLQNISSREGEINAFITLFEQEARNQAKYLDEKREKGEKLGKLAGMVISIKDNISMKGQPLTCGSKMLENFISPYDAEIIDKIRTEDGIIIGKTNMDEFAMGSSTKNSYFGVTKNPQDTTRVSGGSSGGSAASVAAEFAHVGIGSDTGGSVRQPASYCGVVGMKPSYGSISRYGVVSMANTFDQVGVHGHNVQDVAYVLSVLEGKDEKDATSTGNPSLKQEISDYALSSLKVAIPNFIEEFKMDEEVKGDFEQAVKYLEDQGAQLDYVSLDCILSSVHTYYILSNGEIAPNLSRFDGIRYGYRTEEPENLEELYKKTRSEGFGEEVKRRLMVGTHILSMDHFDEYFERALALRGRMIDEFERVFEDHDIILVPTSPVHAIKIEEEMSPTETYLLDLFTTPVNLVGSCGISIPYSGEGELPIGLQFIGNKGEDEKILAIANAFERGMNHGL